jgi:hypothetical protein
VDSVVEDVILAPGNMNDLIGWAFQSLASAGRLHGCIEGIKHFSETMERIIGNGKVHRREEEYEHWTLSMYIQNSSREFVDSVPALHVHEAPHLSPSPAFTVMILEDSFSPDFSTLQYDLLLLKI